MGRMQIADTKPVPLSGRATSKKRVVLAIVIAITAVPAAMAGGSLSLLLFTDIFGGADFYIAEEARRALNFFLLGTIVATPIVAVIIGPIWFILHKHKMNGPAEAFLAGVGFSLFVNLFILNGRTVINSLLHHPSEEMVAYGQKLVIENGQFTREGWLALIENTAILGVTAGISALIIWWIAYEGMPLQDDLLKR